MDKGTNCEYLLTNFYEKYSAQKEIGGASHCERDRPNQCLIELSTRLLTSQIKLLETADRWESETI